MDHDTDVLIVGAGPTGLTLASELLARGVRTRVVDRAPERSDKSRALVVQPRTLELFQKMGAADELLEAGRRATAAHLFAGGREAASLAFNDVVGVGRDSAFAGPSASDTPYPFLLFVSQVATERALERRLERLGGRVERPVELVGFVEERGGVTARLRVEGGEQEARARWIVGCDGAHSAVRKIAGLRFEGAPYEQDFVLADVDVAWDRPYGEVYLFLGRDGLFVLLPLGGPRGFRVVASRGARAPDDAGDPTLAEIQARASAAVPFPIAVEAPRWLARFRLHHRGVDRYGAGRAFVAGDAAHIHSPAGGQGMNTGIQDAYNLAWKLALVARGRASEALLASYHDERHPVGQKLLSFTDRIFSFASSTNAAAAAVRTTLLPRVAPLVLGTAAGRARAFRFTSQLAIKYRRSPIVGENLTHADRAFRRGPAAGHRAPDGPARTAAGEATTLFARLRGAGHQLVVFGGPASTSLPWGPIEAGARAAFAGLDDVDVCFVVGARGNDALPANALVDEHGALHRRYGLTSVGVYLVRPDGYVAFRALGLDVGLAAAHLRRALAPGV